MTPAGAGSTRVRHREFIQNITSDHTFGSDLLALGINVGDTKTFPWLSKIANGYERYCVHSMTISYEPFVSTTETGAILMQVDYDPNDPAPVSKSNMLNSMGASRSAVWMNTSMNLDRKELSYDDHLFVRHQTRETINENLKLYDVGTVFLAVTDNEVETGTKQYGEVWVTYDVTLMVPAFHTSAPNASETLKVNAAAPDFLGGVASTDSTKMKDGSAVNFTTANNGSDEVAITFNEPFTGLVYMEQSGYADDGTTHVELEPEPEPSNGWISKLARIGGLSSDYSLITNTWKYLVEVVAEAGESLVFSALGSGAGDIATWVGDFACLLAPYAESLMLPLLALSSASTTDIRARIQSRGIREILPANEVIPREDWVALCSNPGGDDQ